MCVQKESDWASDHLSCGEVDPTTHQRAKHVQSLSGANTQSSGCCRVEGRRQHLDQVASPLDVYWCHRAEGADDISNDAILLEKARLSTQLFYILASIRKSRALSIVETIRKGNSFEAWRQMRREFEPKLPARFQSRLRSLSQPPKKSSVEAIYQLEGKLKTYEQQSGEGNERHDKDRSADLTSCRPRVAKKHMNLQFSRLAAFDGARKQAADYWRSKAAGIDDQHGIVTCEQIRQDTARPTSECLPMTDVARTLCLTKLADGRRGTHEIPQENQMTHQCVLFDTSRCKTRRRWGRDSFGWRTCDGRRKLRNHFTALHARGGQTSAWDDFGGTQLDTIMALAVFGAVSGGCSQS